MRANKTGVVFLRCASLVQLVERRSPKPDVEGSSPSGRELYKGNENDRYRRKFIAGMV